jgi:hypothetical protein
MIKWLKAQTQEERISTMVRLVTLILIAALILFALR